MPTTKKPLVLKPLTRQQAVDLIKWFLNENTGNSSECLAQRLSGLGTSRKDHPHDPADFNRCLNLLHCVPALRKNLELVPRISKQWRAIYKHWDAIEASLLEEVGLNWTKSNKATKTYRLMRSILDPVETPPWKK